MSIFKKKSSLTVYTGLMLADLALAVAVAPARPVQAASNKKKVEKTILQNVFKLLKKKTIIVISHRFDNNDLFDKKIEILKGNLVYENS